MASLSADEHVALLSRVARGDGSVGTEILRRFRRHAPRRGPVMPLRTVGELRARAEATAEKRRKAARDREAREREGHEREQQAARQRYFTGLTARAMLSWRSSVIARISQKISRIRKARDGSSKSLWADRVSGCLGRARRLVSRFPCPPSRTCRHPNVRRCPPYVVCCVSFYHRVCSTSLLHQQSYSPACRCRRCLSMRLRIS